MQTRNGSMVIQQDLKDFILQRNEDQSISFSNPSARLERQLYRVKHPTEIIALKCMDGRLNLSIYTETPTGIIQPFRNIGGKFNLGWPFFQETIKASVNYAVSHGRRCLILVTYHFSKGDTHRGCAGFGYDTDGAYLAAIKLRDQFEKVFGTASRVVCPVVIGIETDEESLIFHGAEETLDISELESDTDIVPKLHLLFPHMEPQIIADLVPLVAGNRRHVEGVRASHKKLIDHSHREQIIAVGRGFDWLHMPNTALIIGPYSHDWQDAVVTAAKIALSNIEEQRIPEEFGVLLLVAALARDERGSFGWNMAQEKAINLIGRSREIILRDVPKLSERLHFLCGVVDADTRKLHQIVL